MKSKKNTISIKEYNKKSIIFNIFLLFIFFIIMLFLATLTYNKYILGVNSYLYKIGDLKITEIEFTEMSDYFDKDEDRTLKFIIKNNILANLATNQNIEVNEKEINSVEYPYFKEEIALTNKLKQKTQEKVDNVTEEELYQFYLSNQNLFLKDCDINYVALETTTPLKENDKINTKYLEIKTQNLQYFKDLNFISKNINEYTNYFVNYNESTNKYKYYCFLDINNKSYYEFEKVQNELKEEYNNEYGIPSLDVYVNEYMQKLTIESTKEIEK